jgi:hypothetical protein
MQLAEKLDWKGLILSSSMSRGSPFIEANKVAAYDSMLSGQPNISLFITTVATVCTWGREGEEVIEYIVHRWHQFLTASLVLFLCMCINKYQQK